MPLLKPSLVYSIICDILAETMLMSTPYRQPLLNAYKIQKMTVKTTKEKDVYDPTRSESVIATLDDALIMTGFGVYNIMQMLLGGVILMGVITQSLSLGYVLPAARCDLNLTAQAQGLLAATPFLAIIITSYFWGYLGDTRGRKPVMLYTMLISVFFSVLASFAPNLISFAILTFIAAIFTSGSTAVVYTYIGEFNNLHHRDKMVAFGSSFVGIGTVILPAISWLILPFDFSLPIGFLDINYRPWRLLVIACAMPYFFSSIVLYFTPESPKFLYAAEKYDETLEVLKIMYVVNKRKPVDTFPVKALLEQPSAVPMSEGPEATGFAAVLRSMKHQTVPLFKMPLLPWTCLICFVQFGIFAATNGFYVWFPTILNALSIHEGERTKICTILEASRQPDNGTVIECIDTISTETFTRSIYIGLVFCSMYVIVGFLVDYIGKKIILIVILTVTGACGIGAHLANNQQMAVVLFAIFQMSGACIGLMNAVAVELFPTKFRAMAVCLAMMTGRAGSMVGTNLIGFLLTSNCAISFYIFGGLVVANGLLCFTLPLPLLKTSKKPPATTEPTVESTQYQTHEPA